MTNPERSAFLFSSVCRPFRKFVCTFQTKRLNIIGKTNSHLHWIVCKFQQRYAVRTGKIRIFIPLFGYRPVCLSGFHSYLFPNEAKCLNRESAKKRKKKHSVRKIPDQKNQCNRQKNSVIWSATNYYWLRLPTFAEKTTINVNIIMIHRNITNYQYELDILRALACFLVIWQHVTECYYIQPDFTINNSPDITMIGWINSLTPIEVPLFVMISGYFLLPMKSDLTQFFRKRALRVVYPFVIWCIVYAISLVSR